MSRPRISPFLVRLYAADKKLLLQRAVVGSAVQAGVSAVRLLNENAAAASYEVWDGDTCIENLPVRPRPMPPDPLSPYSD